MTPEQSTRKAAFDQLFESIPGTNPERIRAVCSAIAVKEGTVRIWRMRNPPRVPSERSVALLRAALGSKA